MTDRVKGFVVSLEHDMREDDVEMIKQSINMIKGVSDVENRLSNVDDQMNRMTIKNEIRKKILNFYNDI